MEGVKLRADGRRENYRVGGDNTNSVILEDHEDMVGYVHAFDALRSAALTPDRSLTFIRKTMNGIIAENEES
ncbi:Scr1 family TA system antitoxin-like transcriptional regulator [Streptomyces sp. NBC_01242]|uniref:Scr1 family TA system antitoxin-like transcriptional regulator n=1 Tax=unclassified Streptomyces TaxID=2593676 RepID=UPI0022582C8F|nr:Scr1 family TA system antitoxin-like transcriptional regulator [Streptomyces sp. NBC_01242]MCX4797497.1 Scr1 family TA system antitoxin-like transcriptional regulator [Streptomyces sp. NBC_01242]